MRKKRTFTATGKQVRIRFKEIETGIRMTYYRKCAKRDGDAFSSYANYDFQMTFDQAKEHAIKYISTVEGIDVEEIKKESTV